jgi:GLPGLI family protein
MRNFKMRIIPILLIILFHQNGIAQEIYKDDLNYKVTYVLEYKPDSTDVNSRRNEEMYLYVGDNISRFSSAGKIIGDSIRGLDQSHYDISERIQLMRKIPTTEFQYYIYKGMPPGKVSYLRKIVQNKYFYTENKDFFNWTILQERDTIAGLSVQKAITSYGGRNYTAWFTEEIPFSEGPYKFTGLPGLIVKIGDEKNHYVFKMVQIRKLKNPIPLILNRYNFKETTRQKLTKLEKEFDNDPGGFTERSVPGLKINYGSEADKKKWNRNLKEKLSKENNPLELDRD